MKVAIATDDGKVVSQDLSTAKFLLVVDLKSPGGRKRELRLKPRRVASPWEPERRSAEKALALEIASRAEGTHILVAGGVSLAQREAILESGKRIVLTDRVFVDDVLESVAKGMLDDHPERAR